MDRKHHRGQQRRGLGSRRLPVLSSADDLFEFQRLAPVLRKRGLEALTPTSAMHLQQLAGNQAVARLLVSRRQAGARSATVDPKVNASSIDPDDGLMLQRATKEATQRRKRERATAGKDLRQIFSEEAERDLRVLKERYREPGAKSRSVKRKVQDLERYRRLLSRVSGTTLEKSGRQGNFDELSRTPSKTAGKPQTKHVAGLEEPPGMELIPKRDRYAQPDYSVFRRRADGSVERLRVNLKSDDLKKLRPAAARARARDKLKQAVRNSRHLAPGDSIVISFAQTPSKRIQAEMNDVLFTEGSPITEVRYGTTTHTNPNHNIAPSKPGSPSAPSSAGTRAAPAAQAPRTTLGSSSEIPAAAGKSAMKAAVSAREAHHAPPEAAKGRVGLASPTTAPAEESVHAPTTVRGSPSKTEPRGGMTGSSTFVIEAGKRLGLTGASRPRIPRNCWPGAGITVGSFLADLFRQWVLSRQEANKIADDLVKLWPEISADLQKNSAEITTYLDTAQTAPLYAVVTVDLHYTSEIVEDGPGQSGWHEFYQKPTFVDAHWSQSEVYKEPVTDDTRTERGLGWESEYRRAVYSLQLNQRPLSPETLESGPLVR
jgi:hypothetical protein